MSPLLDVEIKYRVNVALSIANGRLSMGMLTSFLTSRVSKDSRNRIVHEMSKDGEIKLSIYSYTSSSGKLMTVTVIEKI